MISEKIIRERIQDLRMLVVNDENPLHKCEFNFAIHELELLLKETKK